MNQDYVIIENVRGQDIEGVLMDFANLYVYDTAEGIRLFRKKGNPDSFMALFNSKPNFNLFSFLVNFIKYPSEIDNYNPTIKGYFRAGNIRAKESIEGEWVMVYVSKNDTSYDNVYFTDEAGKHFINDFGSGIKRLPQAEEPYEFISADVKDYHHIIDVIPAPATVLGVKPWWKFW